REVGPFTAWRDRNFHVDTAWTAIFRSLSNQQAKRGAFIHRQPQSVVQAPLGFNLTDVDLLVLQRSCENREMAAIEKMGKADGLRAEVRMNAYQLAVERAGKSRFKSRVQIDSGCDWKHTGGSYQVLRFRTTEVPSNQPRYQISVS